MADSDFPEPEVHRVKTRGVAWVWLVPVVALIISVVVVVQSFLNQGPVIIVTLPLASGIEAGETPLRFRDVEVGMVEDLVFTEGFDAVEAHIRLDEEVASFVDADAQFWIVEPQVSARGVTGLSTVLSGVYLEAIWDGEIGAYQDRFDVLETPPVSLPGEEGTRIVLRSRDGGQLSAGAPVLYNGIEVGHLGVPQLSQNGTIITMDAFIQAPHDRRLSSTTRFWDISGISINLDTSGLSVNFESLASLLEGGVAYESLVTGGEPIEDGFVFDVYASREDAQRSVFEAPIDQTISVAVLMPADDVRVAVGAVVRYGGVRVGEVTNIIGFTDPDDPGEGVQILVSFSLDPARIGLADVDTSDALLEDLARRVENGLRVRVASEGLLGTTLIMELIEDEDPDGRTLQTDVTDMPVLPTAPPNITEASADLDAIVSRMAALPIEDLMASAIDALNGITSLSTGEDITVLPANLNALVSEARTVVTADEISATLTNLSGAATSLQGLVNRVGSAEGVSTTLTALEGSDVILNNLRTFTEGLPDVLNTIEVLLAQVDTGPLTSAAASADRVMGRLEGILSEEGARQISTTLSNLSNAAASLQGLITRLAEAEGVTTTLTALEDSDTILSNLQTFTDGLPAVLTAIEALLAQLDAEPLTSAAASADRVLARLEVILSAEGAEGLPTSLDTSLTELSAILAALREGGAVANLNGTLDSADGAFSALETAAGQVPTIVNRLNELVTSLQGLASGYDESSTVYRELRGAISDISQTADAFRSLARTIERNPSALIRGR